MPHPLSSCSKIAPVGLPEQVIMPTKASLVTSIEAAAAKAGLKLVSATEADLNGQPTQIFSLGLPGADYRRLQLELTVAFDFNKPNLLPEMTALLQAEAKR